MGGNSCRGFILVVEDDSAACAALISNLANCGYSSSGVRTLAAALLIMRKVIPDVLVLDLALPDGDGELLLQYLRTSGEPRLARTPVVVVSGKSNARDLAPGADAVFVKPTPFDDLLSAIEDVRDRRSRAVG